MNTENENADADAEVHGLKDQFDANRVVLMQQLRNEKKTLDHIFHHGVETARENQVARLAISVILSDLEMEDVLMSDKTGAFFGGLNNDFDDLPDFPDMDDDVVEEN
jgi:hypothetical protein